MDLENIVTPVKADVLEKLLKQSKFDLDKTNYLVNDFKEGFKLHYSGNLKECQRLAPNLKLWDFGTKLWRKSN